MPARRADPATSVLRDLIVTSGTPYETPAYPLLRPEHHASRAISGPFRPPTIPKVGDNHSSSRTPADWAAFGSPELGIRTVSSVTRKGFNHVREFCESPWASRFSHSPWPRLPARM